jgi:FtsP/CotA-like multicopper oxidase with cupredoxin domain
MNENESWLLPRNVHDFTQLRGPRASPDELEHDDEFAESNLMHSINGYVYGTLPGLDTKRGEHVRWHVLDLGTEVDLHTPHWHGNVVLLNGMRTDVVELLPASMKVADMVPDNAGIWLYHCHVNDHIKAGMLARFRVTS